MFNRPHTLIGILIINEPLRDGLAAAGVLVKNRNGSELFSYQYTISKPQTVEELPARHKLFLIRPPVYW